MIGQVEKDKINHSVQEDDGVNVQGEEVPLK